MNIVQAYTKFKGQMIILISGFSGSGKTKLSKFLSKLFEFKYVKLNEFRLSENDYDKDENYVILKNGDKILNWDNIYASIDWNKFNDYINNNKKNGVVVDGFGFPIKLLKFETDFHIHIKINKKNLLEKREQYVKKKKLDRDIELDRMILNQVTFPIYVKLNEDSKIDKFVNTNDVTEEKIKEDVFFYLMQMIKRWLQNFNASVISDNSYSQNKIKSHEYDTIRDINKDVDKYVDKDINKNKYKTKPKEHYEGDSYVYDEFYYPDKKRILYDFNDEGIDYPTNYRKCFNADKKTTSESDSDSDATYLFTRD